MNYITYAISEASKQIEEITESSLSIHDRLLCKNIVMQDAYDSTLTCIYRENNNIFIEPQHRMNAYLCCLTTKLSNLDDILKSELSTCVDNGNITSFSENSIQTDFVNVAGTLELNALESDEARTVRLLSAFLSTSLISLLGKTTAEITFSALSNNVELMLNSQYFNMNYENMLIDLGFMQNKNYYGLVYLDDVENVEVEDDATADEIATANNTVIKNILSTNSIFSADEFSFFKDVKYIVKATGNPKELPSGQCINNYDYIIISPTENVTLDDIESNIVTMHSGANSTVVNAFDILHAISLFLNRLKNIKLVSIKMHYKTTDIMTQIKASGKYSVVYDAEGNEVDATILNEILTGKKVTLGISPYSKSVVPNINTDLVFNSSNKIKKYSDLKLLTYEVGDGEAAEEIEEIEPSQDMDDDGTLAENTGKTAIAFSYLVYDISSGASTEKIIPLDYNGTNGSFAAELTVKKYNNFELTIHDIQEQFNIFEGNIIKRKDVLNAIDYIFTYWIENMSTIDYQINVCHSNCHTNSINISIGVTRSFIDTFEVEVQLPLYYTGGCSCGLQDTNSYNLANLIDKKHLDMSPTFIGNLSAQLVIGTLYQGSDQPDGIYVGSEEILHYPSTRSNSSRISTSINANVGTVTVTASHPSDIRKTKKYFCLAVKIFAKYQIVIDPPEEEDT